MLILMFERKGKSMSLKSIALVSPTYLDRAFLPSRVTAVSSSNVQYRTERIKIPTTPRYPRSMLGSDRGNPPNTRLPPLAGLVRLVSFPLVCPLQP